MISRRALEVTTAVLTGSFGTAILVSSLRIGVGWTGSGVICVSFHIAEYPLMYPFK